MEKLRLSKIMARAGAADLAAMAKYIEERHTVTVLKEPTRTLVMLPAKEPSRGTPFYLGELIATEAMAELEGARGMGVCMGAENEKALAMAVIDAAYNASLEECPWLTVRLEVLEAQQGKALAKEAAIHAATKVSFDTVEGQ